MAIDDMASVRKQRKDICLKMEINYSAVHVCPNAMNKLINLYGHRFVDSYFLQIVLLKPLPIVCIVV